MSCTPLLSVNLTSKLVLIIPLPYGGKQGPHVDTWPVSTWWRMTVSHRAETLWARFKQRNPLCCEMGDDCRVAQGYVNNLFAKSLATSSILQHTKNILLPVSIVVHTDGFMENKYVLAPRFQPVLQLIISSVFYDIFFLYMSKMANQRQNVCTLWLIVQPSWMRQNCQAPLISPTWARSTG